MRLRHFLLGTTRLPKLFALGGQQAAAQVMWLTATPAERYQAIRLEFAMSEGAIIKGLQ